jgi:hypothetical protein
MSGRWRIRLRRLDPASGPRAALVGALTWVVVLAGLQPGGPEAMLLLASLVVVPLGLGLVTPADPESRRAWPWRAAGRLQLPAALVLVASFARPAGPLAAALTLPWLAVTGLIALDGLARLWHGPRGVAEVCRDAGLVYLAIGGAWTAITRAGLRPLGFSDVIVLMTAVHFHYAGFALPLLTSLAARELGGFVARLAVLGVIAGVSLVAAGITDSQVAHGLFPLHALELVASGTLAASILLVGLLHLRLALRPGHPAVARALMAICGLAPVGPMALAVLYAAGSYTDFVWFDIVQMIRYHGLVNALGFVLPGLVAWSLVPAVRNDLEPGGPGRP